MGSQGALPQLPGGGRKHSVHARVGDASPPGIARRSALRAQMPHVRAPELHVAVAGVAHAVHGRVLGFMGAAHLVRVPRRGPCPLGVQRRRGPPCGRCWRRPRENVACRV
eukprot:Amastigsp_a846926_24.p4 type:complete len:110 gc:universal Amastigsp_a846926_24:519-190(-)